MSERLLDPPTPPQLLQGTETTAAYFDSISYSRARIVVAGGGGGTTALAQTVEQIMPFADLTAIVTMADGGADPESIAKANESGDRAGGSSGSLRRLFGVAPPGDIGAVLVGLSREGRIRTHLELDKQRFTTASTVGDVARYGRQLLSIVGLEDSDDAHKIASLTVELAEEVALYDTEGEGGLAGHSYRNFVIAALIRHYDGNPTKAAITARRLLRTSALVLPVSNTNHDMWAKMDGGPWVFGEGVVDDMHPKDLSTVEVHLTNNAVATPDAQNAIYNSDMVVLAPGSFTTSLLTFAKVIGVPESLDAGLKLGEWMPGRRQQFTHISNLTGDSSQFGAYIHALEAASGRPFDTIIAHDGPVPHPHTAFATPEQVPPDRDIIWADLASTDTVHYNPADTVAAKGKRTSIRHSAVAARIIRDQVLVAAGA